jgi:hypothetical protein
MRNLLLIASLVAIQALVAAPIAQAGDSAHGGGGVIRNGQYLTVGSANLLLEPAELQLPAVDFAIDKIMQLKMDKSITEFLVGNLMYSSDRKYYRVAKLSEEDEKRLKNEYAKEFANRQDGDQIFFYGITDPATNESYMLPDFFDKLPDMPSKAAAAFHESLWLFKVIPYVGGRYDDSQATSILSLHEVVQLEGLFESYIRCSSLCGRARQSFVSYLYDTFHRHSTKYNSDNASYNLNDAGYRLVFFADFVGAFNGDAQDSSLGDLLTSNQRVSFAKFLGGDAISDVQRSAKGVVQRNPSDDNVMTVSIAANLKMNLSQLIPKYRDSSLLRSMYDYNKDVNDISIEIRFKCDGNTDLVSHRYGTWNTEALKEAQDTISYLDFNNAEIDFSKPSSDDDHRVGYVVNVPSVRPKHANDTRLIDKHCQIITRLY